MRRRRAGKPRRPIANSCRKSRPTTYWACKAPASRVPGGPVMTVVHVGNSMIETNQVWTIWFEGMKKHEGQFPAEAIVKAEPPITRLN
ncbi:DUF2158 domain-containing protein [Sphingomonas crocodyli]|uniref:DUF2158 domain-containing protein n=1 Tax=Sphingomonas crocodyli TaxID=1979270 RepID=A0A437LXI6_9SPHN|nr:DUF2158 domain-containing protein [Sphingomonas crocodyli]